MWYVIQVQARHEELVAEKCRERVLLPGEQVFVVMAERMFRKKDGWEKQLHPAFQKYVFAEITDVDDFRIRLRQVKESARLLTTGGRIEPIRSNEQELLQRLAGEEHIIRISEAFVEGESLVVTDGPLKGLEGTVKRVNPRQHIVEIAAPLLGEESIVRLGVEFVRRASEVDDKGSLSNVYA